MLDIFSGLNKFISFRQLTIDGKIFRLHYRFTTIILVVFGILVTSNQYFGNPIECALSGKEVIPLEVINIYCWIQATYSSPSKFGKIVGVEVAHPGVGLKDNDDDVRYYKYYQWVWIVLFFQAVLFYLPHYLWKCMENRTISHLLMDLHLPIHDDKKEIANRQLVGDYLSQTRGNHNWYAYKYFLCEVLNFVNVVGQIYFVDRFLDGEFTTYGTRVLQYMQRDDDDRFDPMVYVFPRVTKCMFHKFGGTGEIEKHAALCVLPLNIINEKIYIFMWFWFVILSVLTGLYLIYCIILVIFTRFRSYVLRQGNRLIPPEVIENLVEYRRIKIGDWFILYLLGENMDYVHFKEVLQIMNGNSSNNISVNNNAKDAGRKLKAAPTEPT